MAEQVTVSIPQPLYRRARELALTRNQSVDVVLADVLDEALPPDGAPEYVDAAVEREMQAYIALHPMLKQKYLGQHVAIYGGQLIDVDTDYGALYTRIDAQYPEEFVWLATVEEEPIPTLVFRSPSLCDPRMSLVYTYDYDSDYQPAMPSVEIAVGPAMAEVSLPLTALVDSGADATIIPQRYLRQIRARRGRTAWMRGTTGVRKRVMLYPISLQLGPFKQTNLEVVADDEHDEIIIGRDVLNHLTVTLDWPASSVQIAA